MIMKRVATPRIVPAARRLGFLVMYHAPSNVPYVAWYVAMLSLAVLVSGSSDSAQRMKNVRALVHPPANAVMVFPGGHGQGLMRETPLRMPESMVPRPPRMRRVAKWPYSWIAMLAMRRIVSVRMRSMALMVFMIVMGAPPARLGSSFSVGGRKN